MTAGVHTLYYLADWIAGLPLAGWKVIPPGYAALLVMVTGMMISQLLTKPMARIGLILAAIGQFLTGFCLLLVARRNWCWQRIMARRNPINRFPFFWL
jgi:FtsH-binding integral membrane protein